VGQVIETWLPTQYKQTNDLKGNPLPPGTIRVRFAGGASSEEYAYPADPNRMPIPLYGEQVLCFSQPDGQAIKRSENKWYYTQVVNTHGNVNNAILPFLQDKGASGGEYGPNPIVKAGVGNKPGQLSFIEQDITYIQPFQGDINYPDRYGSILRFSATADMKDCSKYLKKPFFKGSRPGDPIIGITCGVKDARSGKSIDKYYAVEDPNKDASFIYLTSTQYFDKFKYSQKGVGKEVKTLNAYKNSQVIIGAERLVFDARKDEILLVSKKDVKIATPEWQTDMDMFFTQMLMLIEEIIEQNKNLEMAHVEIAALGINSATSIHPTGTGLSGPPMNTAAFAATNAAAITNAITTTTIRSRVEKIKAIIEKMKQ